MDKQEYSFIEKNKPDWDKLEKLLAAKKRSFDEVMQLGRLYLKATEDLSFAAARFPSSQTNAYLNNLVKQCHLIFHRIKRSRVSRLFHFIGVEFPKVLYCLKVPILLSFLVLACSMGFSFVLVQHNVELAEVFVDSRTYEMIRSDLDNKNTFGNFDNIPEKQRVNLALYLWFHNSRVSVLVFGLGITLGIGTFLLLVFNGGMLGALLAVYYMNGHFADFTSLILVHGSIELTAIFIAGGAAFNVAGAILLPGRAKRVEKLKKNARTALQCILGVIFLLLLAGLLEGLITTMKLPVSIRFTIAGINMAFLTGYFFLGAYFTRRDRLLQLKQ